MNRTNQYLTHTLSNKDYNFEFSEEFDFFYKDLYNLKKKIKKNKHALDINNFLYNYIDCDLIYSKFYNDNIFPVMSNIYINENKESNFLFLNLKKICKSHDFMKEKDFFFILEELNQLIRSLFNQLNLKNRSYKNLKRIYHNPKKLDIFLTIILILRPIGKFIRDSLIFQLMSEAFNSYITFIIVNLILNFLVEFIFFIIIKVYFINKTMAIDENMKNLMMAYII